MTEQAVKVFISWSGPRSKYVAGALRKWLPKVLDEKVAPFVSSEDIEKGDRGLTKIAKNLEESSYGIIVITPANQNSPWVNFEAGALGKSLSDSRVAPLLVGLTDSDVTGPLKQFQNADSTDKEAVLALVSSLNKVLERPLSNNTLNRLFDAEWEELATALREAPEEDVAGASPERDEVDVLDEVLTTVRSLRREVERIQVGLDEIRVERPVYSHRSPRQEPDEEVAMILSEAGIAAFSWMTGGKKATFSLDNKAPKVNISTQKRLQDFCRKESFTVVLERDNGESLTINPDGTTDRKRGADA